MWRRSRFYLDKHKKFFGDVRNDIGGHYGEQAAIKAVNNLSGDEVGMIHVAVDGKAGGATLRFAAQVAATTLLFHCHGRSMQEKVARLFRRLLVAYRHATRATDVITAFYFWPKFGRG